MGRDSNKALILILCLLVSCIKDKPDSKAVTAFNTNGNVYIVCEGNFGSGNSSLYSYQPLTDTVAGDVYKGVNSQDLGDVFQSMKRVGDRLFLCVNNSDKVVVLDAKTLRLAGVINIPKPRYILPISASKAYVSSLYTNKVYVIDPEVMRVTDTVLLPSGNTEGMCGYLDQVFVCTWDTMGNQVYKVDANTNTMSQAITVAGYAPQEALLDREQMLWVLSGNQPKGKACALTRLDPSTGAILTSFQFPEKAEVVKPVFNNTRDTLYFIEADYYGGTANNGIYRMGIHEGNLPVQPFVAARAFQYFWALGIDPATGYVYVGDPKGFVQKGSVYVYRPDGAQTKSFDVGQGPGHFYFDY